MKKRVIDLGVLSQTSVSKIDLLEATQRQIVQKRRAGACPKKRRASQQLGEQSGAVLTCDSPQKYVELQMPIVSYSQRIQSIIPDKSADQRYVADLANAAVEMEEQPDDSSQIDKQLLKDNISRISNMISSKMELSDDDNQKMKNSAFSDLIDVNGTNLETLDDENIGIDEQGGYIVSLGAYISAEPCNPDEQVNGELKEELGQLEAIPTRKRQFSSEFLFNSMKPGEMITSTDEPMSEDSSEIFDNCQPLFTLEFSDAIVYVSERQMQKYQRSQTQDFLLETSLRIEELQNTVARLAEVKFPCRSGTSPNYQHLHMMTNSVSDLYDELYVYDPIYQRPKVEAEDPLVFPREKATYIPVPLPVLPSYVELQHFIEENDDIEGFLFPNGDTRVFCRVNGALQDIMKYGIAGAASLMTNGVLRLSTCGNSSPVLFFGVLKRIDITADSIERFYFNCPACTELFVCTLSRLERLDARRCTMLRNLVVDGAHDLAAILVPQICYIVRERNLVTYVVNE